MVKRIATFLICVWCLESNAAQTTQIREMFQVLGTLSSGSPGTNFQSVTGTFYCRPVGPLVTGLSAPGWSADPQGGQPMGYLDLTAGAGLNAKTNGVAGAWFRFKAYPSAQCRLIACSSAQPNSLVNTLSVDGSGNLIQTMYRGSTVTNGTVALNTWYYLAQAWTSSGTTFTNRWYSMPLGGSLTQLATQGPFDQFAKLTTVRFGAENVTFNGRMGAAGVYSISSFADVQYPSDLTAPVETGHTWYLDSTSGSDTNSGLAGFPWQTSAKFNTESQYAGLIDVSNGYANGDTVEITDGFRLGTTNLNVRTRGLNVQKAAAASYCNLIAWTNLANASFSAVSGVNKTYSTTDTQASIVVWEDDKWMNHTNGATWASVSNVVNSVPGSFWTDGTTLYVHPFGDTNPNSDGKVYTRSVSMGASGPSALTILAPDVNVNGIRVIKTALSRSTDSDPLVGYGVQFDTGSGGTSIIQNCYVTYSSKHGIGFTDSWTNSVSTLTNCTAEQCISGTPFVSYNGGSGASGNVHTYVNCTCLAAGPSIGATNGSDGIAITTHSLGGVPFSLIQLQSCNFSKQSVNMGAVSLSVYTNSTIGYFSSSGASNVIERCLVNAKTADNTAGTTLLVRNCLLTPYSDTMYVGWNSLKGTATFTGCTFDLAHVTNASTTGIGMLQHGAAMMLSFSNNIVMVPASQTFTVLYGATNTDTILMDNNVYLLGSGTLAAGLYNGSNRTFSQWQALGFDTHSVNADPCLGANYQPYAKTPCWTTGTEIGPLIDYTGKLFQSRKTAGAYELQANPRMLLRR